MEKPPQKSKRESSAQKAKKKGTLPPVREKIRLLRAAAAELVVPGSIIGDPDPLELL